LRSGRRDQDQKVRRKSVSGSRWRYSEIDGRRSQDGQIFLPKADRLTIVYNGYEPASMGIRMPDTGKMPSRHAHVINDEAGRRERRRTKREAHSK